MRMHLSLGTLDHLIQGTWASNYFGTLGAHGTNPLRYWCSTASESLGCSDPLVLRTIPGTLQTHLVNYLAQICFPLLGPLCLVYWGQQCHPMATPGHCSAWATAPSSSTSFPGLWVLTPWEPIPLEEVCTCSRWDPALLSGFLLFLSFNTSQKHNLITGPHAGSLEK